MSVARSCPLLLLGLALGACASPGVEPNQPSTPAPAPAAAPGTELELAQTPEQAAAEPAPAGSSEGDPDAPSASGDRWADELGESVEERGLGRSGLSEGMGLGAIGTSGYGSGGRNGSGYGAMKPRRKPTSQVRAGASQVKGKLPPEVIRRIVRHNFARLRFCYEKGLAKDPKLEGKVEVHFVIATDGKVARAQGSGDMPDASVVSCVTNAFQGFMFPKPEGGIVTVRYPLVFSLPASTGGTVAAVAPTAPRVAGVLLAKASAADVYKALESAKCTVISTSTAGGATKFLAKRAGRTFTITFVPAAGATALSKEAQAKLANAALHSEGAFLLAVKSNDAAASEALLVELVKK